MSSTNKDFWFEGQNLISDISASTADGKKTNTELFPMKIMVYLLRILLIDQLAISRCIVNNGIPLQNVYENITNEIN